MSTHPRQTKEGIWILDGDPYISDWVESLGRLDHDRVIDLLVEKIPVNGLVVDAGAAIGDHAVFYGHKVGPKGRVLAFEPNPEAFACMTMNCWRQPWIDVFRCGLSNRSGVVQFELQPDNIWASGIATKDTHNYITVTTLDSIMEMYSKWKRFDFLKMDVEGFEPNVIRGAIKSIKKYRPIIASEINKGALRRYGFTEDDIYRPLFDLGYRLEMIDPVHTLDLPQFDCLFLP